MDPQTFMDVATVVTKLKMYPYFDVAHMLLCCMAVRDDVVPQGERIERERKRETQRERVTRRALSESLMSYDDPSSRATPRFHLKSCHVFVLSSIVSV